MITIESTLWSFWPERAVRSGMSESTEVKDVSALTAELARLMIAKMNQDRVL